MNNHTERRHLEQGTKAVIHVRYLQASAEWEAEQKSRREEANRKRSEAMEGNLNASKTRAENSGTSPDGPLSSDPPKKDRSNWTETKVAQAAGVSSATAGRALILVEKRPDLADKVQAGEITLNEASRLMKKDEVKEKVGALPEGKFRVIYADPPWKYGDGGSGKDQYGLAERHSFSRLNGRGRSGGL